MVQAAAPPCATRARPSITEGALDVEVHGLRGVRGLWCEGLRNDDAIACAKR